MSQSADAFLTFQEKYLTQLKTKSFSELSALPPKTHIQSPDNLSRWKIYLLRKAGENGGVRIEVDGYQRFLLIFTTGFRTGFEILSDGTLLEDDCTVDDGDD